MCGAVQPVLARALWEQSPDSTNRLPQGLFKEVVLGKGKRPGTSAAVAPPPVANQLRLPSGDARFARYAHDGGEGGEGGEAGGVYHEAGWDAYCTGLQNLG